jgi:hypothetical protein
MNFINLVFNPALLFAISVLLPEIIPSGDFEDTGKGPGFISGIIICDRSTDNNKHTHRQ